MMEDVKKLNDYLNTKIGYELTSSDSQQTFEEYMTQAEEKFGIERPELKSFDEFNNYITYLEELYYK